MTRLYSVCIAIACALVAPPTHAQPVKRIGVIYAGGAFEDMVVGLRAGLKDGGLVEGKHIVFHVRNTKGDLREAEPAARDLESEQVDVLVSMTTDISLRAKRATRDVPIVFYAGNDPVQVGLVKSFAKPGDRATGVHNPTVGLVPKRVEVLHHALPKARTAVVFHVPDPTPTTRDSTRLMRETAARFGIEVIEKPIKSAEDLLAQVEAMNAGESHALLGVSDALVSANLPAVIQIATKRKVPVIGHELHLVQSGALAAYGSNYFELGRAMAKPVRVILAGTRPQDIPVETYDKVQLGVNLRVAQELGVTLPQPLILRADQVIR